MTERLLRVTGKNFVAGAVFVFDKGVWQVERYAPIIRKFVQGKTMQQIKLHLERSNLQWEWL